MSKKPESYKIGQVRMSEGSASEGFYITGLQGTKEKPMFASRDIVNREDDYYDGQFVQYIVNEREPTLIEEVKSLVEK